MQQKTMDAASVKPNPFGRKKWKGYHITSQHALLGCYDTDQGEKNKNKIHTSKITLVNSSGSVCVGVNSPSSGPSPSSMKSMSFWSSGWKLPLEVSKPLNCNSSRLIRCSFCCVALSARTLASSSSLPGCKR